MMPGSADKFYVAHPYAVDDMFPPLDTLTPKTSYRRSLLVTHRDVMDECVHALYEFMRERGSKAGYLLVGWRTWLRLGWGAGGRQSVRPVAKLLDVPVVVDEQRADWVQAMPRTELSGVRLPDEEPSA